MTLREQLLRGDASIIGVGQGRQSRREALPKQVDIALALKTLAPGHDVYETVDPDGERGVLVAPALPPGMTQRIGNYFGQRSVLSGKEELSTSEQRTDPLTRFEVESVTEHQPEGFWTYLPEQGYYYKLAAVRPHTRRGRPVVGYATRRRVRGG